MVAISDLHLGSLLRATWLAARVEQVRAGKPDLVILIGDVFEGHSVPAVELLAVLESLSAPPAATDRERRPEDVNRSARHMSGIAVRFPRMLRIRSDKTTEQADTPQTPQALIVAI